MHHPKSEDTPMLVAQTGPLNGQKWMLAEAISIGRDKTCEIVIPDRQVSRRHAVFTLMGGSIRIEDLRSKNGTHLNGKRLQEAALLQNGDVIQIALAQEFVFISADATIPLDATGLDQLDQKPIQTGLQLHKKSRRVWIGDKEVVPPLSVAQFRLLELLYDQEGKVVSRDVLTNDIWGDKGGLEISNQALDALIRRLRDRLAEIDITRNYIITVRGHGLRLDNHTKS